VTADVGVIGDFGGFGVDVDDGSTLATTTTAATTTATSQ
jgi:hypothetical protein